MIIVILNVHRVLLHVNDRQSLCIQPKTIKMPLKIVCVPFMFSQPPAKTYE